ncbi:MAG: ABC transporter substrate-binding protein, partial [Bacteroidales bacterium]|nr:ABC transporter substrate-binding protein [Bacteroidales bacterium]
RAIIGSLDGRNGHLAEQVATKSHLTYIETFATEPTLSQAFVPWFMRVVPNDNQQSAAILNQIGKEGGGTIGILSTEAYDTRYAVKSLTKAVVRETGIAPLVLDLETMTMNQREVIEKILNSEIEHLVIPFDADYLQDFIISLREVKPALKIYGTLHFTMGAENRNPHWDSYENVYMIAPGTMFNKTGNEFRESYRKMFGSLPDSRSAYMYDAVNLVINAIHQAGTDRETITDYLSESEYSRGATGNISFDDLGNRQSIPSLILIKNGVPQLIQLP